MKSGRRNALGRRCFALQTGRFRHQDGNKCYHHRAALVHAAGMCEHAAVISVVEQMEAVWTKRRAAAADGGSRCAQMLEGTQLMFKNDPGRQRHPWPLGSASEQAVGKTQKQFWVRVRGSR